MHDEKKRSDRRKHCTLAVARRGQKYLPRCRPPSRGAQEGQNLISWRWSLPSPTDPVWWRLIHAISSYRGSRPTNKQTHWQDRLQYTVLLASVQCNSNDNAWVTIKWLSTMLVLINCSDSKFTHCFREAERNYSVLKYLLNCQSSV